MQNNSKNTDIDLVLEIRPWTFIQSRRSDIHYYYHAVENVPMMFDGFESLPIKIDGKRLGMVNYSDSQKKDFNQLTGVYIDELMLKMELHKYFRGTNIYPFEVESEEILTNVLKEIFAEKLKKEDEYAQRERLLTSWFYQEKVTFLNLTGININEAAYFSLFISIEKGIKLNELIDLEEIFESKERVISLIGEFYQMEKGKRMKNIKTTSTPPQAMEEIIDKVNGLECAEFNNLFGADIKGKNEIWHYMIDLKMIDAHGKFLMGSRRSFIRSFVVIMMRYFKVPNQSLTKLIEIFTLKLLGKDMRINESRLEDEQQIEVYFNGNEN